MHCLTLHMSQWIISTHFTYICVDLQRVDYCPTKQKRHGTGNYLSLFISWNVQPIENCSTFSCRHLQDLYFTYYTSFFYKEQLKILIFGMIAVFWYWRPKNWWTVSVGLQISTCIEVWSPFSEKRHADGQRNRQNLALLVYLKLCISRKTVKKVP